MAAWLRPDTLSFPVTEGSGYVHWLGKGETGRQEWVFRMYSQRNSENRDNRISFYVFHPEPGQGIGAYVEEPVTPGEWIHVVGVADSTYVHMYKNGVHKNAQKYAGRIVPAHGSAPVRFGTRDFASYFQGALAHICIWSRALSALEVSELYASSSHVSRSGLVAEWLFALGQATTPRWPARSGRRTALKGGRPAKRRASSRLHTVSEGPGARAARLEPRVPHSHRGRPRVRPASTTTPTRFSPSFLWRRRPGQCSALSRLGGRAGSCSPRPRSALPSTPSTYIVPPALVLTYLLFGPPRLRGWLLQLLGAGAVLTLTAGWWTAVMDAIPAGLRPLHRLQNNNLVLDLGYDGARVR